MTTPRTLPLAVWVAIFTCGSVLIGMGVATASLLLTDDLTQQTGTGLALGAVVGLLLSLVAVLYAARLAAGLRELRRAAVVRLHEPSAPVVHDARPMVARTSTELADLAMVLEALHVRVRVGDQVGEQHRRDAQTAGAGVFELLSGLVAAEEAARGQLAAELHDTVAQSLMIARGILGHGDISEADIVRVSDYVEDAEEQVRAVMARTRPPALREGDLATAVSNLRLDMQARYGLVIKVDWPQDPQPLPLASAVTVYRFFQEALLNVVKHADIDEAEVGLRIDADTVTVWVTDHGPGFDPAAVRPDRGRHVGLGLLRERARLSGGRLDVVSAVGEGATLTLCLPRPAITPPAGLVEPVARSLPTEARAH